MKNSEFEENLERVKLSFARIEKDYSSICDPIRAIRRTVRADPTALGQLDAIKRFKFYPKLPHVENTFFEQAQSHSYRLQRAAQVGVIRKSKTLPPNVLSCKQRGAGFARRLGLPVPERKDPVALADLGFDTYSVIKPLYSDGGKCVHAIKPLPRGQYIDVFAGKTYGSSTEVKAAVGQGAVKQKIRDDYWLQEEVIVGSSGEPTETLDVKFYTFYGEIAVVLQVDRWRSKRYRFFNANGNMVDTGSYSGEGRNDMLALFDQTLVGIAKDISLKIPWPHVRIDFLVSDTDLRFGEFTLQPGRASMFSDEWDATLGRYYVAAQARLYEDLIAGKKFSDYQSVLH